MNYRLGQRVLTIGRGPANLIQLLDQSVSRRHATILWEQSAYLIRDLKSKNGIEVNHEQVVQAHLQNGDVIQVGETTFQLVRDTGQEDDSVLRARSLVRESVDSATIKLDKNAVKNALADEKASAGTSQANDTVPVDVDEVAKALDERVMRDTNRLKAQASAGRNVKETISSTLAYIVQTMDADRCIAYRTTGGSKLDMAGFASIPHLDKERKTVRPFASTVKKVLNSRSSWVDNDVKDPMIFSAAAVPIHLGEELVGVVYADSMRRNPRYFIEHDVEMLGVVSGVLGKSLYSA